MKPIFFLGLLTFAQLAHAALPPTAESLRRIKLIVESKEVYDKLGSVNWIHSIQETKEGYLVKSDKCSLLVKVEPNTARATHPLRVGPTPLQVTVGKLECKS